MPVILHPEDYDRWLDPMNQEVESLQPLLVPFPADEMQAERVSDIINNVRSEVDPRLPAQKSSGRTVSGRLFDDVDVDE